MSPIKQQLLFCPHNAFFKLSSTSKTSKHTMKRIKFHKITVNDTELIFTSLTNRPDDPDSDLMSAVLGKPLRSGNSHRLMCCSTPFL